MRALLAVLLLLPSLAIAQAKTVLSCAADWGASSSCGGCSDLRWSDPSTDPKVYTTANQYWTKLSTLKDADLVAISVNPPGPAVCSTGTLITKATLLGASSTPVTPPPPTTPPTSANGTATLSWTLPTQWTDGKPLTTLAGTEVFAGISVNALTRIAEVPVPATSYTASGLIDGTWYFAVRVLTTDGFYSGMTNPVSLVVQTTTPPPPPPPPPPPAAVWKVATNGTSATRPAYELILNATGTASVRGYQLGTVPVGKPCGDAKLIAGTTEYHSITEADVTLQSPTYKGRALVAVCTNK